MVIVNIIFATLAILCGVTFLVSSLISMINKNEKYEKIANNSAINMCIYMFLWIAIISIF